MSSASKMRRAWSCSASDFASVDFPTRIGPSMAMWRGGLNAGSVTARDYSKVRAKSDDGGCWARLRLSPMPSALRLRPSCAPWLKPSVSIKAAARKESVQFIWRHVCNRSAVLPFALRLERQMSLANLGDYQDFAIAVTMRASESTSRVSITSAGECE